MVGCLLVTVLLTGKAVSSFILWLCATSSLQNIVIWYDKMRLSAFCQELHSYLGNSVWGCVSNAPNLAQEKAMMASSGMLPHWIKGECAFLGDHPCEGMEERCRAAVAQQPFCEQHRRGRGICFPSVCNARRTLNQRWVLCCLSVCGWWRWSRRHGGRRRLLLGWEPASFGMAEELESAVRTVSVRAFIISQVFVSL